MMMNSVKEKNQKFLDIPHNRQLFPKWWEFPKRRLVYSKNREEVVSERNESFQHFLK